MLGEFVSALCCDLGFDSKTAGFHQMVKIEQRSYRRALYVGSEMLGGKKDGARKM
jgi:hypothetical protein